MAFKSFLIMEEHILQDNLLSLSDKLILAYIEAYWRQGDICISSNNQIAKYLNLTRRQVIKSIKFLSDNDYIKIRYLKSNIKDFKGNELRAIEKPTIGKSEQLSLLFKSVVYGNKNKSSE
jgi:DNA-binding Lrp family transcriptional regulator